MKRFLKKYILLLCLPCLVSCTEYFATDPNTIINTDDYIAVDDEMYKGFLGIITRMQRAGDHAIFLTDTRGDFLEVTGNAPVELYDIYNYSELPGNSYADPRCYYAVVIACNDFLHKMKAYRERIGASMEEKTELNFNALVSSTLRIKVWAYYTLGRIYGQAYWFDDPIEELVNLDNKDVFTLMDMPILVNKCLDLLDNGVVLYGDSIIPATLTMDWPTWINPETQTTAYDKWNYMVPQWLLLKCELLSWRGHQDDWLWIRDSILEYLYRLRRGELDLTADDSYHCCRIPVTDSYYTIFFTEEIGLRSQAVSRIMYDYNNEQTNRLVDYFCPTFPCNYYLRPSRFALNHYNEEDIRSMTQRLMVDVIGGDTCLVKYYYHRGEFLRTNLFEIMPSIIMQRSHDYYFLLAEAENHLGNWSQAESLLNMGVTNKYTYASYLPADWSPYYSVWFGDNGGYGDIGVVGCARGRIHELPTPEDDDYALTEAQRIRLYDEALADEYLKEFTAEGKSYSYLVKMAERYQDPEIVSERVCGKYSDAQRDRIRSKIESKGYWVEWDLRGDNDAQE